MATIRRTCTCRWCISSFGMNISDVKRHRTTFEDGSSEIAVSSVDFLVSNTDSFVMGCNKYYISKCIGGNINKGGLWDTVLSELERTCISKVERLPKYGSQMETVYTVPIIGHMQFPPTVTDVDDILGSYHESREESAPCAFHGMKRAAVQKVKRNPAKYLFWEGKYFDTAMVYEYDATRSNSLRALGPLQPPLPTLSSSSKAMVVEFIKGVSYRNRQGSRCHNARLTHSKEGQHTHCTGQGGWTQQGEADYLEINLAYPRYVTHIGIAGEYPGLKQFPTRRIVGKRRLRTFRASEEYEQLMLERQHGGIKASKFAPYVKIVGGSGTAADLGSVSSYEVHYRHHVSNKWTLLAVTDASAGDPLQEAVLDLRPYFNQRDGLFTQTLRIRPLGHHLRPVLRAAVYGLDMKASVVSQSTVQRYRSICEQDEVDHSSSTGSGSDTDGEQDAVADRDVTATIQYVLAGAHSGGAVKVAKDGRSTYHNSRSDYSYDYGRNPKAVKNRAWQSTIKETLRQKPWKDRFCGPNCDFCWPA